MRKTIKRTRPRGFASWTPRPATMALLCQITDVLIEYREHLPLTIRQVFYRLVGSVGFEKTERGYARLCETVNRARRAGNLPFDDIRDDGVTRLEPNAWDDTRHFLEAVMANAERFRLDRQKDQPTSLWVLCEASGMAPMLARVAGDYGVPVLSSGGFDSLTAKHDLARELAQVASTEILHIGDHDPSGVHLFTSLSEDVSAMVLGLGGSLPVFTRLAVTAEQALEMNLPTAPAKASDRRAFEGDTVQAEAIPPDTLARLLREAIEDRQDPDVRAETLIEERQSRETLVHRLEAQA